MAHQMRCFAASYRLLPSGVAFQSYEIVRTAQREIARYGRTGEHEQANQLIRFAESTHRK